MLWPVFMDKDDNFKIIQETKTRIAMKASCLILKRVPLPVITFLCQNSYIPQKHQFRVSEVSWEGYEQFIL